MQPRQKYVTSNSISWFSQICKYCHSAV